MKLTLGNSRKGHRNDMLRGPPVFRYHPIIAYRVAYCSREGGGKALSRRNRVDTRELVARGVPTTLLHHPACDLVTSRHFRGKERTIICAWVHVLMCVSLLLGLLHDTQDFRSERVNEFCPRDVIWALKQALDHLHMGKCEMF